MNNLVRSKLIEVAKKILLSVNQELCDSCGLKLNMRENPSDRAEIGKILGEISAFRIL